MNFPMSKFAYSEENNFHISCATEMRSNLTQEVKMCNSVIVIIIPFESILVFEDVIMCKGSLGVIMKSYIYH